MYKHTCVKWQKLMYLYKWAVVSKLHKSSVMGNFLGINEWQFSEVL